MIDAFKKLSVWKAISDVFLYLSFFGFLTGIIGTEFYSIASIPIFGGAIVSIIFLVKQFLR